jgi:hypothetical protein
VPFVSQTVAGSVSKALAGGSPEKFDDDEAVWSEPDATSPSR